MNTESIIDCVHVAELTHGVLLSTHSPIICGGRDYCKWPCFSELLIVRYAVIVRLRLVQFARVTERFFSPCDTVYVCSEF